jgi:hypothetical protein
MLVDEDTTLAVAASGSSTAREVVCGVDSGAVAAAVFWDNCAHAAPVVGCGRVCRAGVAACDCGCGDVDDVGIDADPVGLESAGDAESGAAAATPCPAAIAAPRPAATAPARSHRTERGVALRR